MTVAGGWEALAIVLGGAVVTLLVLRLLPSRLRARLAAPNHRGSIVPAVLGLAVFAGGGTAFVGGVLWASEDEGTAGGLWAIVAGLALILAAGLVDDLLGSAGPRGLRGHARALRSGRATTGLLKAGAALAAGIMIVVTHPRGWVVQGLGAGALGLICIAACANVWNALDVRPGRALKGFLVAAVILLVLQPEVLLLAFAGAAAVALWPDLREQAMLGDAGAFVLGLTVGTSLYLELPLWGLSVAAALAVALNLVAETVTLSRIIRGVAPLRWFDDLGRIRPTEPTRTPDPLV